MKTMPHNKKESKPSILEFKRQTGDDLSTLERLFLVLSIFAVGCAAVLSIWMCVEEKPDSPKFIFAISLGITTVFLLVYPVHGVFWRMPYSLLLDFVCNVVLIAYCIVFYALPENKESIQNGEKMQNVDLTYKILFLVWGGAAGLVKLVLIPHSFGKYWQARTMKFLCEAETPDQDAKVKHLFVMCLLLLNLHLELTSVAFVLKIDETGLANSEIVKLILGVIYSTSMCVLGFLFLYKKWKLLLVVIPLASLAELAYITYYLIVTEQTWTSFPDEVIPAFIIVVCIGSLYVRISVCWSVIYIYINIRTKVDDEKTQLVEMKLIE